MFGSVAPKLEWSFEKVCEECQLTVHLLVGDVAPNNLEWNWWAVGFPWDYPGGIHDS